MSKFIMSFDVISSNRKQIKLTGDSNLIFIINNSAYISDDLKSSLESRLVKSIESTLSHI